MQDNIPTRKAARSLLATWARQGAEGFIATQRILLDLATQQSSLALGVVRERTSDMAFGPAGGIVEFAAQSIANFLAAQKILLDLVARENAVVHQGVKGGLGMTGPPAALADVVHGGVDALVAMQRKFLNLAVEQGDAVMQSSMNGEPLAAAASLAEKAQEGLKTFIETQQRFLDLVLEKVSQPARKGKKAAEPAPGRKLAELAKEGIDAFVAVEQQLLDLAFAQVAAAAAAARPGLAGPSTPLGEIARRGVANLVNAQKALLDVAAKPFLPSPPHPSRRAARKR